MTHSPDFGAETPRRKSAPTSRLCCVIPIWYQIFLVPDSGTDRLCVLFRADFWYARDHYSDQQLFDAIVFICLYQGSALSPFVLDAQTQNGDEPVGEYSFLGQSCLSSADS